MPTHLDNSWGVVEIAELTVAVEQDRPFHSRVWTWHCRKRTGVTNSHANNTNNGLILFQCSSKL